MPLASADTCKAAAVEETRQRKSSPKRQKIPGKHSIWDQFEEK
jgi:hypothetical protein